MTDKKITQLTALTGANAVAGDQLAIVDVSDTTMSASGTTKKIALSELQAAPLSAGTANGVVYLNGSKVLTTGSALTFDGTNLGLGVTPSAWSVGKAVEVGGLGTSFFGVSSNELYITQNTNFNAGWKYGTTAAAARYGINSGVHQWFTAPSGTAGDAISFTQAMTLDASGNLLVGKTSADLTSAGVWTYNAGGTAGRLNIVKTAGGTLSSIANYYSGTYVGGVDYSNTATSFPTSSDVRLKKDIVDAPSASGKIDQIRIVSHGWKHDDETVEFGVIAQELYFVTPQAVSKGDDGETVEKAWGVDYSKLVPMLIKEIQSLRQRLAAAGI